MRRRVGGAMSRQLLKAPPVKVRITRGLRGGGIGLAKVVGALLWGAVAGTHPPQVEGREDQGMDRSSAQGEGTGGPGPHRGRVGELIDLQLDHLGKPLYAVVGIVTTVHRRGEGEALIEGDSKLASVTFEAERVERTETSRETGGSLWVAGRWQNDITRTRHSIELDPFTSEELTAVLAPGSRRRRRLLHLRPRPNPNCWPRSGGATNSSPGVRGCRRRDPMGTPATPDFRSHWTGQSGGVSDHRLIRPAQRGTPHLLTPDKAPAAEQLAVRISVSEAEIAAEVQEEVEVLRRAL